MQLIRPGLCLYQRDNATPPVHRFCKAKTCQVLLALKLPHTGHRTGQDFHQPCGVINQPAQRLMSQTALLQLYLPKHKAGGLTSQFYGTKGWGFFLTTMYSNVSRNQFNSKLTTFTCECKMQREERSCLNVYGWNVLINPLSNCQIENVMFGRGTV